MYPQQLPGAVVVVGNTLTVTAAGPSSAGEYTCSVNNSRTGAVAAANGTLNLGRKVCRSSSFCTYTCTVHVCVHVHVCVVSVG